MTVALDNVPVETILSIGPSSTQVVAANARRRGLILQNIGANPITVRFDGSVAGVGQGFILNPQSVAGQGGGFALMDHAMVLHGTITAIAATAPTALYCAELF